MWYWISVEWSLALSAIRTLCEIILPLAAWQCRTEGQRGKDSGAGIFLFDTIQPTNDKMYLFCELAKFIRRRIFIVELILTFSVQTIEDEWSFSCSILIAVRTQANSMLTHDCHLHIICSEFHKTKLKLQLRRTHMHKHTYTFRLQRIWYLVFCCMQYFLCMCVWMHVCRIEFRCLVAFFFILIAGGDMRMRSSVC